MVAHETHESSAADPRRWEPPTVTERALASFALFDSGGELDDALYNPASDCC